MATKTLFKRSTKHLCVLLEAVDDPKNEEKIRNIQYWYPVQFITGVDRPDVRKFKIALTIF